MFFDGFSGLAEIALAGAVGVRATLPRRTKSSHRFVLMGLHRSTISGSIILEMDDSFAVASQPDRLLTVVGNAERPRVDSTHS